LLWRRRKLSALSMSAPTLKNANHPACPTGRFDAPDGLVDALALADAERLATVAGPWSQTEEFFGAGDPEELTNLLQDLSRLAREARSRGETVYCWVSV
jgi:hypothetical protein